MSLFAVSIEEIGEIRPALNADRLELASLKGKDYEFVVGKGVFSQGDKVVYFPVDSLLPQWISDSLELTGKLAGSEKNRVKTIKLRGNISQGIVAEPALLATHAPDIATTPVGAYITALLGVEKYEPPAISSQYGDLRPLPPFVSKYDIEGAQNYVTQAQALLNELVCITEKLEGSHWSIAWFAEEDKIAISQRNYRIEPVETGEHDWFKVARLGNFAEKLRLMANDLGQKLDKTIHALNFRGELIGAGIQSNYYKVKEHQVYLFEIEVNGSPVDAELFLELCQAYDLPTVPVLAVNICLGDWLAGKSLKEASNGNSVLGDLLREGIVIRPMQERREDGIGRLILKQRSPDYLAKSEY